MSLENSNVVTYLESSIFSLTMPKSNGFMILGPVTFGCRSSEKVDPLEKRPNCE